MISVSIAGRPRDALLGLPGFFEAEAGGPRQSATAVAQQRVIV